MEKILITGVAGFIGSNLAKYLLENDIASMYTNQANVYHIIENNDKNVVDGNKCRKQKVWDNLDLSFCMIF